MYLLPQNPKPDKTQIKDSQNPKLIKHKIKTNKETQFKYKTER